MSLGLIDLSLHLDQTLPLVIEQYGRATFAILFAIHFRGTELVVTPFHTGDSLLFVSGMVAAVESCTRTSWSPSSSPPRSSRARCTPGKAPISACASSSTGF